MQAFRSTVAISRRAAFVPLQQRTFSLSVRASKDAADSIKETADSVNKTAGQTILKNVIEPVEKASQAIKNAVGAGSAEASKQASDLVEDVKGAATNASYTAEQVKAEANKKANNVATEARKAAK